MSKRMFEFVEGTSSKFWEIWIEGTEVRTRYGRIGTGGQTTIKDEGDPAKAQKLYDKLVTEKTKKGYAEVGGGGAPAPAPAAAAPAAKAAKGFDRARFAPAIARITAAAKKRGFELPPGASMEAIEAAEKRLGVTFPDEVRAFYLTHDGGSSDETYNCNARELLSLEGIVSQWEIWKDLLDKGTFGDNENDDVDTGLVQEKWWIAEWIPVTYDGAGNHEVLDLAPGESGKRGQILAFWHDDSPRTVKGPDFLTWLSKVSWTTDLDDFAEEEDDDAESGESAWRRFEVDEKFWAIKLDGASHTVRFGKIGTSGQEKTKDFDDEEAAKKDYDKLVLEKTKKGYEEVDPE